MTARFRPGLGPTAVLGLAGAGLAAVSSAQVWGRAQATLPAVRTVEARGADVAPVALPLALVALASWGAILVLRLQGRRVVAVLGLAASLGVIAAVLLRVGDVADTTGSMLAGAGPRGDLGAETTPWPYLACLGAALAAMAFLSAVRSARSWPEMSRRYDSPTPGPSAAADPDDPSGPGRSGGPDGPEGPGGPAAEVEAEGSRAPADLWRELDEGHDPTA